MSIIITAILSYVKVKKYQYLYGDNRKRKKKEKIP